MQIKRHNLRKTHLKLPPIRETKEVQLLWCADGWSYLPQLKIRRSFETTDGDSMKYTEEPWDGVVPSKVLYNEKVLYTTYNHKKMWSEIGHQYSELYVVDEA